MFEHSYKSVALGDALDEDLESAGPLPAASSYASAAVVPPSPGLSDVRFDGADVTNVGFGATTIWGHYGGCHIGVVCL